MNSSRQKELTAKTLLNSPSLIATCIKEKKWEELLHLCQFVKKDAPKSLIGTDNALYKTLRMQITNYHINWNLNEKSLRKLIKKQK